MSTVRRRLFSATFVAVIGLVLAACGTGSSKSSDSEPTERTTAASSTCTHELTCSGGPLSKGTGSSTGCIPPSGNANGYCVPDVCNDPAHAYCCTSTWDNGCAQYAADFNEAHGWPYNELSHAEREPGGRMRRDLRPRAYVHGGRAERRIVCLGRMHTPLGRCQWILRS
jgi:hypothetical protein